MQQCDLTLPSPEENLALDEALLDACEAGTSGEVLRLWEPARYFVVVGYGNQASREVNLAFCRDQNIPVLRRCSGGGTVLQGPGCLNYSLLLCADAAGPAHSIPAANEFILRKHQQALAAALRAPVERHGHTDLAIGGLKFCGNAQRRRQRFLLFHGCFLLHLDISMVEHALPQPSRQPDYRLNRSHQDFLMNLLVPAHLLKSELVKAWDATEKLPTVPLEETAALVREKYGRADWNMKF